MSYFRKTSNVGQISWLRDLSIRALLPLLIVCGFLWSWAPCAFAAADMTNKGFVEYQTNAPVDFTEVIEVTLTDKETGYYYTHHLYRVNEYLANLSIPFGTYSVGAKVISDTGADVSSYSVIVPIEDIVVQNAHSAVPILLRVDMLVGGEVSEDDYSEPEVMTDGSVVKDNGVSYTEPDAEAAGDGADTEAPSVKQKKEPSLLVSTLSFLAILAIATVGYLWFKHRYLNKK